MRAERLTQSGDRRGLSISEVLLSLAITSMLLVGVAAAYNASANAIDGISTTSEGEDPRRRVVLHPEAGAGD